MLKHFEQLMKNIWQRLSEKQRQWAWFAVLWFTGLGSVVLLGSIIRMAMGIE